MRQPQQNKRMRGRGRKPSNSGNRVLESNGPDVKIRGSASHIAEKYVTLARDAQVSGDRIVGENYLQHAEHYFRIVAAAQSQNQSKNEQPKVARTGNDADNSVNADQPGGQHPSGQNAAGESRPSGDENQNSNDRPPRSRGRRRKPDAAAASEQPDVGKQENKPELDTRDTRPSKKTPSENGSDNSEPAMAANTDDGNVVENVATDAEGSVEPKTTSDPGEPVEAV